jgi:hypothetical protein
VTGYRGFFTDQCGNEQRATFFANFNLSKMSKIGGQGVQVEKVDGSVDFSGFSSRCWESVRVTHGTGMGRKCAVCAAEHECDSGEDESSKCDNKADGAFPAHPAGRRAFRPPSAAQLLGVPSASGMPSSPLLDGGLKLRPSQPIGYSDRLLDAQDVLRPLRGQELEVRS